MVSPIALFFTFSSSQFIALFLRQLLQNHTFILVISIQMMCIILYIWHLVLKIHLPQNEGHCKMMNCAVLTLVTATK